VRKELKNIWIGLVLAVIVLASGPAMVVQGLDSGTSQDNTPIQLDVHRPVIQGIWFNQTAGPAGVGPRIDQMIDVDGTSDYSFSLMIRDLTGINDVTSLDLWAWYDEGSDAGFPTYNSHNNSYMGNNLNLHLAWAMGMGPIERWGNQNGECQLIGFTRTPLSATTARFEFDIRPMYQWRWAKGPTNAWNIGPGFNDDFTWNFNATAYDTTGTPSIDNAANEFGVYRFMDVDTTAYGGGNNPTGAGAPGQTVKLTSTLVDYSSNCPYKMGVNITDLVGPSTIPASNVFTMGGDLNNSNFTGVGGNQYYYGRSGNNIIAGADNNYQTLLNGQRKVVRDSLGNIYATYWYQGTGPNSQVIVNMSSDGGETWSQGVAGDGGTGINASMPSIAIDSQDTLHLVWAENGQIYYAWHRVDRDITSWSNLTTISGPGGSTGPVVAIDGADRVHFAWIEDQAGLNETFFRTNISGVYTPGLGPIGSRIPGLQLSTTTTTNSANVTMAVTAGNDIIVVWDKSDGAVQRIYHNLYTFGVGWGVQGLIPSGLGLPSRNPCVAISTDPNAIFNVVWQQAVFDPMFGSNFWQIYYFNEKLGMGKSIANQSGAHHYMPSIAVNGWDKYVLYTKSDLQLYCRRSGTWKNEKTLTQGGLNYFPNVRTSMFNNPQDDENAYLDFIYVKKKTGVGSTPNIIYSSIKLDTGGPNDPIGTSDASEPTGYNGQRKVVRMSNGTVYTVYVDQGQVWMNYSTNDGLTWKSFTDGGGPISDITMDTAGYPSLALDGLDRLHLIYVQDTDITVGVANRIFYRIWNNPGWSPREMVSSAVDSNYPVIAVDAANVAYIAYCHYGGIAQVHYRYGGFGSWTPNTGMDGRKVSEGAAMPYHTSIALDPTENVHIVWESDQIYYNYTVGGTFQGQVPVTSDGIGGISTYPCIAVDENGYVHIIYHKDMGAANFQLTYINFTNRITGAEVPITDGTRSDRYGSLTFNREGTLLVIWQRASGGNYMYLSFSATGATWSKILRASGSGLSQYPIFRWSQFWHYNIGENAKADLVWTEGTFPNYDVMYSYLNMNGKDWYLGPFEQPNADGYRSNGSALNEPIQTDWWVYIPIGTPEGTYTATITFFVTYGEEDF